MKKESKEYRGLKTFKPKYPKADRLYSMYWNVPFSEVKTFDLLRLLNSARICFEIYKDSMRYMKDDRTEKYIAAIKKELKNREHLSTHERKSARLVY